MSEKRTRASLNFRRGRRATKSPKKQSIAVRICQAMASRTGGFQFTPSRVNRELKSMNRQLASQIAAWKVKFRKCSDDLLQQKSERSQDWMEMALLRQEIDALRRRFQSPYVDVFAIHKQQLVSEFEKQMALISSHVVELFREKVDEVQEAFAQRAEEFPNKQRNMATVDLVTPQDTPHKQEEDMDIEQLIKNDTVDIDQLLDDSPAQLSTESCQPDVLYHQSTPIQTRENSSRRRRISAAFQTPCLLGERNETHVSGSEERANVGKSISIHVEESAEEEGDQEEEAVETRKAQDENLSYNSRSNDKGDDDMHPLRNRSSRRTCRVSYLEPKISTKLRRGDPHTIPIAEDWCHTTPEPSSVQKSKPKKLKPRVLGDSTNKV